MSMAILERAILTGAKVVLANQKLKMRDIMQWSTGKIEPQPGEIVLRVSNLGVYIAVKAENDKRKVRKRAR